MPRVIDTIAQFQNVVAGQRAVIKLPTNHRYHKLELRVKNGNPTVEATEATMRAILKNFRILLNGKEQRTFSAGQAFDIYAGYGQSVKTGVFTIHFSEPWWQSPDAEDVFAWSLRGQAEDFRIELDIDATAVNPQIECKAFIDSGVIQGENRQISLGFIKKWVKLAPQVANAGPIILDELPLIGNYTRLHCFEGAAGDITEAFLKADNTVLYSADRVLMAKTIEDAGGALPADLFTVAFDANMRAGDFLVTETFDKAGKRNSVVPLNLQFQLANANNFEVIGEVIGQPN